MIRAKESNPQAQTENRPLRIDQEEVVEIIRITIIENSHDIFREARQTSSIRLEKVAKCHLPDMRKELVTVLNKYQDILRQFRRGRQADDMEVSDDSSEKRFDAGGSSSGLVQQTPQAVVASGPLQLNSADLLYDGDVIPGIVSEGDSQEEDLGSGPGALREHLRNDVLEDVPMDYEKAD